MKEIEQDATVPSGGSRHAEMVDHRNYVTMFQVPDWPPVDNSQLRAIDVDNGPGGSLNARR